MYGFSVFPLGIPNQTSAIANGMPNFNNFGVPSTQMSASSNNSVDLISTLLMVAINFAEMKANSVNFSDSSYDAARESSADRIDLIINKWGFGNIIESKEKIGLGAQQMLINAILGENPDILEDRHYTDAEEMNVHNNYAKIKTQLNQRGFTSMQDAVDKLGVGTEILEGLIKEVAIGAGFKDA
jgi:hypothetical protein